MAVGPEIACYARSKTVTETLQVTGLTELIKALHEVDRGLEKEVREGLREGGQKVQGAATARFMRYGQKTARGFRTVVRQRGVSVEQSLRKTTGLQPQWGKLQMRKGLLPALEAEQGEVAELVEKRVGGLLHRHGL
jgi:hypothetical protein